MSQPGFPKDPDHGTIFELQSGLFFVYDTSTQSWSRAEGGLIPNVATPITDGLMQAEDLVKLNRMVVPPPTTTITSEGGDTIFTKGIISLTGGDQFITVDNVVQQDLFVNVEGQSKIMNVAAAIGESNASIANRDLHLHSHSFDFGIDVSRLFQHMVDNEKFRVSAKQGIQGLPGERGSDGVDDLPFGPDGARGDPGANAQFAPGLLIESIPFKLKEQLKRAVVDITTETNGEDENYLVVTRANIGNINACPNMVTLTSDANSTWMVAMQDITIESETLSVDGCRLCVGDVYYIDATPILNEIKAEFDREAARVKKGIEDIVSWWLVVMAGVFDEQKAALCCALENCKSQTRNVDTRRYLEQSRIQAAISDHSLLVDGDPYGNPTSTEISETIMEAACEPDGFGTLNANDLANNSDPIGGYQCVPFLTYLDGVPLTYSLCPIGFTPRPVYREFIKGLSTIESLSMDTSAVRVSSLNPDHADIVVNIQGISKPQPQSTEQVFDKEVSIELSSIQLYQITTNTDAKYDFRHVTGLGDEVVNSQAKLNAGSRDITINDHIVNKYSDLLSPGTYYLCISNSTDTSDGFDLIIASQNAVFQQGYGDGWSDDLVVQDDEVIDGIKYAGNTIIRCKRGPIADHPWWLRIRVLETKRPGLPYSTKCGSTGQRWSGIDERVCSELSVADGNPMIRKFDAIESGQYRQWHTSKCGGHIVPDAASVRLGGHFSDLGSLVLCRVNGGNYSGGFSYRGKSAQILVEQLETVLVRHYSVLEPKSIKGTTPDRSEVGDGSTTFKCTMLIWDGADCSENMVGFDTITIDANPNPWSVSGEWRIDGEGIKFDISGIDNNYGVLGSQAQEEYNFVLGEQSRKKVSMDVSKGTYIAILSTCCVKIEGGYTGHAKVRYQHDGETVEKQFPNFGVTEENKARSAYQGLTMEVDHTGGEITVELATPTSKPISEQLTVRLVDRSQIDNPVPEFKPQVSGDVCKMQADRLAWYEQGWINKDCVGASISVSGQDYIIINRTTEQAFDCSTKFEGSSIAWPTIDGETLINVPKTGSITFKRDETLEEEVKQAIEDSRYINDIGDLRSIDIVLFPTI
jgi:hypothetical protein